MSKPFDGKCPPHLAPLLSKLLDDSLSDEQRAELQSILRQDRDCRRYYLRFMQTHAMMQWSFGQITAKSANVTRAAESRPDDEQDIDQFLDVLAGLEESAGPIEPVDITKHLLREEAERKAREAEEAARRAAAYKAQARRLGLSKDGVQVHKRLVIPTPIFYGGIAATIALLLVIGYSTFQQIAPKSIPSPPIATTPTDRPVVATLVRTLDAVWAEHHVQVKPGEKHEAAPLTGGVKLREGDTYTLQQGFAQLDTNSGAIVVLEAPCEIELLGENEVRLTRGKLVGKCLTPQSKGFAVDTPAARIVDLGTEFGVLVDKENSEVDAYVYNGRVTVTQRATSSQESISVVLNQGEAAAANADGVIKVENAERIASKLRLASPRVTHLDLVDIVAGGDGTSDRADAGLDPQTGQVVSQSLDGKPDGHWQRDSSQGWQPVSDHRLIDGVFVVDRVGGSTTVDSRGSVFSGYATSQPKASPADAYGLIWASRDGHVPMAESRVGELDRTFAFIGRPELDARLLTIVSGAGVTFDLSEMRAALPVGRRLSRFQATATNAGAVRRMNQHNRNKVEIHVVVDGEVRFSQMIDGDKPRLLDIRVNLRPTDRMMSLVVTGGGDGINSDWVLIGRPKISLDM